MTSDKAFGEFIRKTRTRACWSQMQLGFILGVRARKISQVELGESSVRDEAQARDWADKLQCDVEPFVELAMAKQREMKAAISKRIREGKARGKK